VVSTLKEAGAMYIDLAALLLFALPDPSFSGKRNVGMVCLYRNVLVDAGIADTIYRGKRQRLLPVYDAGLNQIPLKMRQVDWNKTVLYAFE
jgi:hypothetical protein